MSDLVKKIASIKKELVALKAGFAGGELRFKEAVVTNQVFTLTHTRPLTITVDFEYDDFPFLYTSTRNNTYSFDYQYNAFQRRTFLSWRWDFLQIEPINVTVDCFLVSEKPPTLFVISEE